MPTELACYECLVSFLNLPRHIKAYSFCPYHLVFSFFKSKYIPVDNGIFYSILPCECKLFTFEQRDPTLSDFLEGKATFSKKMEKDPEKIQDQNQFKFKFEICKFHLE